MSHYVTVPPSLPGELVESGCIIYIGPGNGNGYGVKRVQGKKCYAHRLALEAKLGRQLLPGHCACHTCDVRGCINPDHLFEGTYSENTLDAVRKGRYCKHSQKLSESDLGEIRQQLEMGVSHTELAQMYGVTVARIGQINKLYFPETVVKPKLNKEMADEIRGRLAAGEKYSHLANEYGVSDRMIRKIKNGEAYK